MNLYKTYKYRLNPTKSQVDKINQWLGTCRFLYNSALEHRINTYQKTGKSVHRYAQHKELPAIKKDMPWVADVYSTVLIATIDRLDRSYNTFFNGGGFPKFRNKHNFTSFTYKSNFKVFDDKVFLPKLGDVKYCNSRPISGTPKTATITKEQDKYYILISVKTEIDPVTIDDSQAVGIDVGIVHFATLSDDTFIDSNLFLEPNLRKLRILQRKLARQVKGSKSRDKTKNQIAKLHRKIKNQRDDFNHKISTMIADKYSSCYVEDLKIKNMTKLNSTLSRRLLDNGFYSFRLMLDYKFKERSKFFLAVDPKYTSQTCSCCGGGVNKKSRLSQSEYVCTECGYIDNADVNAAKNIMSKGIAQATKRKAVA